MHIRDYVNDQDVLKNHNQYLNKKQEKYFMKFLNNMNAGISYYTELFDDLKINFKKSAESILDSIKHQKFQLEEISKKIELLKKQLD